MAGPNFYRQGGQSKNVFGKKSGPLTAANDASIGAGPHPDRHDIGSAALSSCPNCGHSLGGK